MAQINKCTHRWKYCNKCHDWGCATAGCPNQIRAEVGGGLLSFSSYKCTTCLSKKCSLCDGKWFVCNKCGDGGCSNEICPKYRWEKSSFFTSGGCKTCKSGKCGCGNWTWSKQNEDSAGCNNPSCGKYNKIS